MFSLKKVFKEKKIIIPILIFLLISLFAIFFLHIFPTENEYMGISFNAVDTNTYISFIKQAKDGDLLFTNKFTSEPVSNIIFRPVFLLIGICAKLFGVYFSYYLFKIIFILIFVVLVHILVNLSVKKKRITFIYDFYTIWIWNWIPIFCSK